MNRGDQRIKALIYTLFSIGLTTVVFAYLFTHITWEQVMDLIVAINRPLAGLFVLMALLMQVTRTVRYRLVLRTTGQDPGFFRLFLAVLVRGLCVDLLPARVGEVVYIYILRVRLGVELGAATASFALAFLFDIMALAPLLVAALVIVGTDLQASLPVLLGASVVLLALSGALIHFLPWGLRVGFAVGSFLPSRWHRFRPWCRRFLAATHRQVKRARKHGVYLPLFGLSVLVRLLKYGALYVLLWAMLEPRGYALGDLSFPRVFLGLCSAEVAASLPISGIGGFGAYEGAWSLVFELLGFPGDLAKATSLSHHLFTQAYGYSLGIIAVLVLLMAPGRGQNMLFSRMRKR